MHTHCCIQVVHGQCWVHFSHITLVQWINHELCLDGFSKPIPPLALCSHVLDLPLKGVIFMMDANPLLNSLHPLLKWCGLSTPSPNTSINCQWISRVEMFCLYKLSHHKVFCMTKFPLSLPLHITYPLNSMINWFLYQLLHVTSITVSTSHQLLHVTSITVCTSYHKIKWLLNKIIELGTLITEQASYIDCHWETTLRNIMTPFSVGLWR